MITTDRTNVSVPRPMIDAARERYPELGEVSLAQLLKFALALALGKSRAEAAIAMRDARTLTNYV